MEKNLYSTFQAAKILGVSPDTVLKWIKSGKIRASRTVGGHFRIGRETITKLISERKSRDLAPAAAPPHKTLPYCWEFNSTDKSLEDECRNCLVYRTRAKLCYEMSSIPQEFGHLKLFCDSECENCDYYRYVKEHSPNILVITDDAEFLGGPINGGVIFSYSVTSCEYECSAIVEKMRPEVAVIDCSFHRARDFCDYLANDSRVPYIRLILASEMEDSFDYSNEKIVSHVSKPFTIQQIKEYLTDTPA